MVLMINPLRILVRLELDRKIFCHPISHNQQSPQISRSSVVSLLFMKPLTISVRFSFHIWTWDSWRYQSWMVVRFMYLHVMKYIHVWWNTFKYFYIWWNAFIYDERHWYMDLGFVTIVRVVKKIRDSWRSSGLLFAYDEIRWYLFACDEIHWYARVMNSIFELGIWVFV